MGRWLSLMPATWRVMVVGMLWGVVCVMAARWASPTAHGAGAETRPKPRGTRLLGINVNEAEDKDFGHAFGLGREAGLEVVSLKLDWDDVEKTPGQYASAWPAAADAYYSAAKVRLSLRIATLDTNRNRIPADLRRKDFDDPRGRSAFQRTGRLAGPEDA